MFSFTRKQCAEFEKWKRKFDRVNCGAVGGGFTYNFVVADGVVVDKYVDFFKGGVWRPYGEDESDLMSMTFGLTSDQFKRANDWVQREGLAKATYKIVPTSIGTAFSVVADDGRKIELSDFDDW